MLNATAGAMTEAEVKAYGCGIPIAAPGAFDPYKFISKYSYFVTAMPPASTFQTATLDAVFNRDGAKTYGYFVKGGDADAASLATPWRMALDGTLGAGYTGIKEVGKLCSGKANYPHPSDHTRCSTDSHCPTGETCISPVFETQVSCMVEAMDQLAWFRHWKAVDPDVIIIGSGDYNDVQNFINGVKTIWFTPKAVVMMLPFVDTTSILNMDSLYWRGTNFSLASS